MHQQLELHRQQVLLVLQPRQLVLRQERQLELLELQQVHLLELLVLLLQPLACPLAFQQLARNQLKPVKERQVKVQVQTSS